MGAFETSSTCVAIHQPGADEPQARITGGLRPTTWQQQPYSTVTRMPAVVVYPAGFTLPLSSHANCR